MPVRFILVLMMVAGACAPKKHRALPEWMHSPSGPAGRAYAFGVSLPLADTAEATLQARRMAAALLAVGREVRITSFQSLREDSSRGQVNESNARFLASMPSSLPPVSRLVRLENGVTLVEVSESAEPDGATQALELSWFERSTDAAEDVSISLVSGADRLDWGRSDDSLYFQPYASLPARPLVLKATDWEEQPLAASDFQSATGDATFGPEPGAFSLAFLSAYAHALSHLSHSIQSEMAGSQQMFTRKKAGTEVKTSSNTIIPGVRVLKVAVFETASGVSRLEITLGTPRAAAAS